MPHLRCFLIQFFLQVFSNMTHVPSDLRSMIQHFFFAYMNTTVRSKSVSDHQFFGYSFAVLFTDVSVTFQWRLFTRFWRIAVCMWAHFGNKSISQAPQLYRNLKVQKWYDSLLGCLKTYYLRIHPPTEVCLYVYIHMP